MKKQRSWSWQHDVAPERVAGTYTCGIPGPLIFAMGSIHGNEPAGRQSIKQFLQLLNATRPVISGMFLGMTGNLAAYRQGRRFIDKDLNRCFRPEHINAVNKAPGPDAEDAELREIAHIIHALKSDFEDVCFVDCHTTSAPSIPYLSTNAHPESLQLAHRFPLYNVVGLEQSIPGCFAEYCNKLDFRGFTFEAGQHQHPDSVRYHIALLWLLLVYCGALKKDEFDHYDSYVSALAQSRDNSIRTFRLLSHYRISDGEQFVMDPGFVNFMPVRRNMRLATNRHGEIRSPADGFMLMPLYQQEGDDGFFLLEEECAVPDSPVLRE